MDTQKLQKALAERGLGSRRELEGWIAAGRVTVNGERAHVGERVRTGDVIAVDGRRLTAPSNEPSRVRVLNKAAGVICARRDPQGRPSIFDEMPKLRTGRWIAVGRLDLQTTGLLLLTNDGALAHRMMHPSTGLDREYAARVDMRLDDVQMRTLSSGLTIDGTLQRFSDVRYYDGSGRNHWYHVVLMEGRNREARTLFERVGVRVSRLKRVRYGPVVLPSRLKRGTSLEMSQPDLKALYGLLNLPFAPRRGKVARQSHSSLLLPYPRLPHLPPATGEISHGLNAPNTDRE